MLITEVLGQNATVYGDEIALIEREPGKNRRREITWAQFDNMANQVARSLLERGVT
jgi:acyl-CoA synthetase (AMP-forming)/AMP-acid ligase II